MKSQQRDEPVMNDTPTFDCATAASLLSAYMDGELDAAARCSLERHLSRCPACRGRLSFERRLARALRELSCAPVPEEVESRIRRMIATFHRP